MDCRDFQKIIPDIINNRVPDECLEAVVNHISNCRDCYDELEIYFVLEYGLKDDDTKKSMNLIGRLNNLIKRLISRAERYYSIVTMYNIIKISAYTVMACAAAYMIFKVL